MIWSRSLCFFSESQDLDPGSLTSILALTTARSCLSLSQWDKCQERSFQEGMRGADWEPGFSLGHRGGF